MLKHATFFGAMALSLAATGVFAEGETAATVVATVDGHEITLGQMIIARAQLPQQYAQLPDDVLFEGIIDQLVQQQVLAEGFGDVPARVDFAITNERRSLLAGEEINRITMTAVTDEAIQAAYDVKFADAEPTTEYHAAHLLVETEDEAIAAKARVDEGEDFASVAKDVSTGPTGPNGGDLGWFGAGQMVPEFEEAVKTLAPEEVSGPVQTQFGWHIVKLLETRNAEAPALEDVRDELFNEVQETAIQARLTELKEAAEIVLPEADQFDPTLISNIDLLKE